MALTEWPFEGTPRIGEVYELRNGNKAWVMGLQEVSYVSNHDDDDGAILELTTTRTVSARVITPNGSAITNNYALPGRVLLPSPMRGHQRWK